MIGYNEGNGHPYSFSAIVNGYNPEQMALSPYPVILNYLKQRNPFEFGIYNLSIDYIWTPDAHISQSISKSCYIPNIAENYLDFVDEIDAVIIARDDAECHREIAEPFLNKGKFVFIDKPLCTTLSDLEYFIPFLEIGMLMSCSGFRFHPLYLNKPFLAETREKIICGTAVTTVDWFKYGIHVLEGLQPVMNDRIVSVQNIGTLNNDIVLLNYANGKNAIVLRDNMIKGFYTDFYTTDGTTIKIKYDDNFSYFRNLLFTFHDFITQKQHLYHFQETINLIKALIASVESKNNSNMKIFIE